MERPGSRTARRGLSKAVRVLRSPVVLLIVFGIPTLIIGIDIAVNVGVRHWLGRGLSGTGYGFFLGVGVTAAFLILLAEVFVLGGGVNWITGAAFERETGKVLAGLGPQWRVAHNLAFTIGPPHRAWEVDVDHVAVGPYGVLVVETKYSSSLLPPSELEPRHRDVRQARKNAALVEGLLHEAEIEAPIRPVLIYWGWHPKVAKEPVTKVGDVRVVYGADSERWLPLLASRQMPAEVEEASWAVISEHAVAEHP